MEFCVCLKFETSKTGVFNDKCEREGFENGVNLIFCIIIIDLQLISLEIERLLALPPFDCWFSISLTLYDYLLFPSLPLYLHLYD